MAQNAGGGSVRTPVGPEIGPYIFGKTLGTGATGKVKLAKNIQTGELAAIKIVRKEHLVRKPSLKKKLQREITVMKLCNHPNVLRLLDVFEIDTHLFLVLEFVDGCELFQYLVRHGPLSSEQALKFFRQLIAGVEYCHKRLICHRDLKPENLLLDRNLNLRVADFGMTNLNIPGSLLETSCGSPHYAAPEVVSGDLYNGLEADIWSCGVILYAMVAGRLPFDDDNIQRLLLKVQRGVFHFPTNMDPDIKALIKGMMMVDPKMRLTIPEIKQNPWYNSIPDDNPFVDDFVAPEEPIRDPNPAVLQGLVDLGWGDNSSVRHELAKPQANLVKVFYVQLEKHPMFHKNVKQESVRIGKAPEKGKTEKKSLSSLKALMKQNQAADAPPTEKDADAAEAPPTEGTSTVQENSVAESKEVKAVEENGQSPAEVREDAASATAVEAAKQDPAAHVKRSTSLVRQSELMQRPHNPDDIDISKLALENARKNGQDTTASWFDTFRLYFIGGGI
uniref:Protein kinase domain-containing protein n=5 Tax=Rhodosorus marinus TaxID=101924 RepID=A0A7S3EHH1_9RHOD|mmetsp:Transcript_36397/g.145430  ORF Transcript_36397/g.145430 Transcript_36397/m.145430 type:complete len:504 (+) Transcript_36397:411-1922(+)